MTICGLFFLLLAAPGCNIEFGDWSQEKYERTVQKQAPLAAGSTLNVQTSSGHITIEGADVNECSVVAEITGRAPTDLEAQELAEQTQIELELAGNTLTIKTDKPRTGRNRSISVSFDIIVPREINIRCESSYGAIKLTNIKGEINGRTSSGSVKAENIEGPTQLNTSYGSVAVRDITGEKINIKTSSGAVTAENIKGSTQLDTSYGSVTCEKFSGDDIRLKTSSGRVKLSGANFKKCDVDTSYGSIETGELDGQSIKLHSGSGGIDVTNTTVQTADISTSYGHIKCRQITVNELKAKSGSGGIDIACSEATPVELIADINTSYGSIDFAAPPGFSGQIELATSYGSINTELPITVVGQVSKKNIKGSVGDGNGRLYLKTGSGSINIK